MLTYQPTCCVCARKWTQGLSVCVHYYCLCVFVLSSVSFLPVYRKLDRVLQNYLVIVFLILHILPVLLAAHDKKISLAAKNVCLSSDFMKII